MLGSIGLGRQVGQRLGEPVGLHHGGKGSGQTGVAIDSRDRLHAVPGVGGATLVHLSTAYGEISAALTFSGCRAVLIATRNDATTLSAVARLRGR